jgi:hypothetical protein
MTDASAFANATSREYTHERFVTKGGYVTVYATKYYSERLKELYDSTCLRNGQCRDADPVIVHVTLNPKNLSDAQVRYPDGSVEPLSFASANIRGRSLAERRAELRAKRAIHAMRVRSSSDQFEEAILRNHLALVRKELGRSGDE